MRTTAIGQARDAFLPRIRATSTDGMKRLDGFVRAIERHAAPIADVDAAIAHERRISKSLGGRTVFDDRKKKGGPEQLGLFR